MVIYGINSCMAEIIFPEELRRDTANKFGNQFMAIYINVDDTPDSQTKASDIKTTLGVRAPTDVIKKFNQGDQTSAIEKALSQNSRKTKHVVFLPVPTDLKTNFGVKYTDVEFGTEALKIATSALGSMGEYVSKVAKDIGGVAAGLSGIVNATKDVGALAIKGASFKTRLNVNPHKELLFEGGDFREFNFSWKLIARNANESKAIKNIVSLLRYHMHPGLSGSGLLFKYPSDFDIEFYKIVDGKPQKNDYLSFIATSVLTNLDIDYSGGEYSSFKDTVAPVEIDLTLKFRETVIITKNLLQQINEVTTDEEVGSGDKNDPSLNIGAMKDLENAFPVFKGLPGAQGQ